MNYLGNQTRFSGIELYCSLPHEVGMRQTTIIEKLQVKHGIDKSKPVSTPISSVGWKGNDETALRDKEINKYCGIVGSPLYLAVKIQPDIAVAASTLGPVVKELRTAHLMGGKMKLRYLRGITHYTLTLKAGNESQFTTYADAN